MRSALIAFATVSLGLVLLIAACGGGNDGDDGNGAPDVPDATQPALQTTVPPSEATTPDAPTQAATQPAAAAPQGNATSLDACSLLTADEVSEALGKEVGEGMPADAFHTDASGCEWISADSAASALVEVLPEGGSAWYDTVHFGQESEPIEGLGDKASYDDLTNVFDVVKGDYMVSIQIILFFSDVDNMAAGRALAERVIDHLP